jgi:hypothetical protein
MFSFSTDRREKGGGVRDGLVELMDVSVCRRQRRMVSDKENRGERSE